MATAETIANMAHGPEIFVLLEEMKFNHGSLHHLIENVFAECELAREPAAFERLLTQHVQGVPVTSRWLLYGVSNGLPIRFDFQRGPNYLVPPEKLPVKAFGTDVLVGPDVTLDVLFGPSRRGATVQDHYASSISGPGSSPLPERVTLVVTGTDGRDNSLLSQQCFLHMPGGVKGGVVDLQANINKMWNGIVRAVRSELHWPRARLPLLAVSKPTNLSTSTSAESLNSDLVGKIFYHMLNGPKDTQGFEVAGMYALPFEERPVVTEADVVTAVTAAMQEVGFVEEDGE